MDTILNISKATEMIGKQKIKPGTYRPSVYNYHIPYDDVHLIFNLFTRGMIALSNDEYASFSTQITVDPNTMDPFFTSLIEDYYFVPFTMDEQQSYLEMNDLIHLMDRDQYINSYTVLTTTACNARCFYCFEQDFEPVSMTKETAQALVEYMISHADGRKFHIHWFGGEPLCNVPVIDLISDELNKRGIKLYANMTSNGYAFTPEIIARVKDQWHLGFVQITLDGMEEEHNRRKNYKAATGSPFLRTMENIHALLDAGVTVSLRVNFDPDNVESVKELLPYLVTEFANEKNLIIYVAKIFEDCGSWKSGRSLEQSEMMTRLHNEFTQYLIDHRFSRTKPIDNGYRYYYCGSNNPHHRTISPDGKFLVCHNLSDSEGFGSIFDGITDKNLFDQWLDNAHVREKCDHCPLLPECTAFKMCPSVETDCAGTIENSITIKMRERYRRYLLSKRSE